MSLPFSGGGFGQQIASMFVRIGADTIGLERGLKKTDEAITGTAATAAKAEINFKKLGAAMLALGSAYKIAKTIYDIGKQGAELQQIQKSFEYISGGAEKAEVNLEILRRTTRNTVSDIELMSEAVKEFEKTADIDVIIDDNSLAFERWEANIKNVTDAMKANVADALTPFFNKTAETALVLNELVDLFGADVVQLALIEKQSTGSTTALDQLTGAYHSLKNASSMDVGVGRAFTDLNEVGEDSIVMFTNMTNASKKMMNAALDNKRLVDYTKNLREMEIAWAGVQLAIQGPIGNENQRYNASLDETKTRMAEIDEELAKLEASHGAIIKKKQDEMLTEKQLAKLVQERGLQQFKIMQALSDEDRPETALIIARAEEAIERYDAKLADATITTKGFIDNSKKIADLKGEYGELEGAIRGIEDAHAEATKRILFNMMEQRISMSDLTLEEEKSAREGLYKMAVGWGLVDQATADAWATIDEGITKADNDMITYKGAIRGVELQFGYTEDTGLEVLSNLQEETEKNYQQWLLYEEAVGGVAATLENMPTDVYTTLHVRQLTDGTPLTRYERTGETYLDDPIIDPETPTEDDGDNGDYSSSFSGDININGVSDPEAAANAVIQKLADRGILRAGGYR